MTSTMYYSPTDSLAEAFNMVIEKFLSKPNVTRMTSLANVCRHTAHTVMKPSSH